MPKYISFFTTDSTADFDNHASSFFGRPVSSKHLDLVAELAKTGQ